MASIPHSTWHANMRRSSLTSMLRSRPCLPKEASFLARMLPVLSRSSPPICWHEYAVGVGSGTEALHLALLALGIGAGDEVITVPHTAVATVAAIELAGARPVLVDVDPATMTMDPAQVEQRITCAHQGNPAGAPLRPPGRPCANWADSAGATTSRSSRTAPRLTARNTRAGGSAQSAASAASASIPTKNLGAYGDGGMVVTNDPDARQAVAPAARVRLAGALCQRRARGANSRLDEMQAAILRVKLRHLDEWTAARRALAARYCSCWPVAAS